MADPEIDPPTVTSPPAISCDSPKGPIPPPVDKDAPLCAGVLYLAGIRCANRAAQHVPGVVINVLDCTVSCGIRFSKQAVGGVICLFKLSVTYNKFDVKFGFNIFIG